MSPICCVSRRRVLAGAGALGAAAFAPAAFSQLQIQITGVGANRIPLALQPMNGTAQAQIDVYSVVASDLERTGSFRLIGVNEEATSELSVRPDFSHWQEIGATVFATGSIVQMADGRYDIRYRLFDSIKTDEPIDQADFFVPGRQLRLCAHRIADRIYSKLTGNGAMFASRLSYVVQHAPDNFELIVADSDGANPQPALRSREPIISPAWSPDGKSLAYVSFEEKKPVVYVHTVATGKRRVIANFRGNNSAPAFSPDGKTLALALSRDGFTQIYLIGADGTGVRRFTRSLAIDTEPVFSVDGRYVYFTSDRGGSPQIYRQTVDTDEVERVTFASDYAVSPSINPQGTHLAYVTRTNGRYRVAQMEIATGQETILSGTDADESPCYSPNGRMIVYATEVGRRGVLATVSVDGAVSSRLSGSSGDIREPTWSPLIPD